MALEKNTTVCLVLLGFVLVVTIGVPIGYVLNLGGKTPEVILTPLLVVSVVSLLVALAFTAAIFSRLGLTDKDQSLGLPEGSIRAVIALSLILIFMISSVFIYWQISSPIIKESTNIPQKMIQFFPNESIAYIQAKTINNETVFDLGRIVEVPRAGDDIAKQIITTLSTLVVAVAGFYFGTRAVSVASGVKASSDPVIRSIIPDKGKNGENIQFEISGKNFELGDGGTVKLICDKVEIPGTDISSSPTTIRGKFTVPQDSKVDSKWSVVVTNADKGEDRLEGAFTVSGA